MRLDFEMTFKFALTTAAAIFAATSVFAGEITLNAEMEAASLHEAGVDMVVYYTDADTHYEVVATYVEPRAKDEPLRMRMGLVDGDEVTFALPMLPETAYTFARKGTVVSVKATLQGAIVAQK